MTKHVLVLAAAISLAACNSSPSQTAGNTVGGANIVFSAQAPLATAATSFSLDWGPKGKAGQVALADVVSYGGPQVTITAPAGWNLIRDDSTSTTRQSLYWRALQASDASIATWTFGSAVDVQGAILLLDNAADPPIDGSSGNKGDGGTLIANSMVTTASSNLILSFYATDFSHPGLLGRNQPMPDYAEAVLHQDSAPNEFWIFASYQPRNGPTQQQVSNYPQLFNWTAAQVAIKRSTPIPAAQ